MQNVDKLEPVNNAAKPDINKVKPDINKVKPDINKVKPVPAVSIIVPVFNEAAQLDRLIAAANSWKADDLVFVDGGSDDGDSYCSRGSCAAGGVGGCGCGDSSCGSCE